MALPPRRVVVPVILPVLFGIGPATAPAAEDGAPIDVARGRELMQRAQRGEALSLEEQAYLGRVRREIARRQAPQQQPVERDPSLNRPEMGKELILASARAQPATLLQAGFAFEHPELRTALQSLLNRRSLGGTHAT